MISVSKIKSFSLVAFFLFVASIGHTAKDKNVSPFLGDLSQFKRSKERKTMLIHQPSEKRAVAYKKMMFEPVQILQSEHSKQRFLTKDEKKKLSNLFQTTAVDAFKDVVEIVDSPGEGVLRVRFAIRGWQRGRYYLDAQGSKMVIEDKKMPAASFEVEAIDSVTDERIIALVDEMGKPSFAGKDEKQVVPTIKEAFQDWVLLLRNTFRQEQNLSIIP